MRLLAVSATYRLPAGSSANPSADRTGRRRAVRTKDAQHRARGPGKACKHDGSPSRRRTGRGPGPAPGRPGCRSARRRRPATRRVASASRWWCARPELVQQGQKTRRLLIKPVEHELEGERALAHLPMRASPRRRATPAGGRTATHRARPWPGRWPPRNASKASATLRAEDGLDGLVGLGRLSCSVAPSAAWASAVCASTLPRIAATVVCDPGGGVSRADGGVGDGHCRLAAPAPAERSAAARRAASREGVIGVASTRTPRCQARPRRRWRSPAAAPARHLRRAP